MGSASASEWLEKALRSQEIGRKIAETVASQSVAR